MGITWRQIGWFSQLFLLVFNNSADCCTTSELIFEWVLKTASVSCHFSILSLCYGIVFHYFFFIWWFLPCFFLFNFTVAFYSRLIMLSSIFTVDFPDCVPSQKKKEAERKKPRPTSPGNTGLTHFHSYNHYFFYKSHATLGSANQKELDCPKSQGHPRLQMSCAHHGMKPTPSIPVLVALRHFY